MEKEFLFVEGKDFSDVRKEIKNNPEKKIIFSGSDDDLNRKVLEKLRVDVFLVYQRGRKDFQKQRGSGFNQVLARILKNKNITLGINLDEVLETYGKEKAEILGRIRQNIRLSRKKTLGLNIKFISKNKFSKDEYDLRALGLVLGMSTSLIKNLK